jgi:hypothetical protein
MHLLDFFTLELASVNKNGSPFKELPFNFL